MIVDELWKYTKRLITAWGFLLFLVADVIGLIINLSATDAKLPVWCWYLIAALGLFYGGFQVFRQTQIQHNQVITERQAQHDKALVEIQALLPKSPRQEAVVELVEGNSYSYTIYSLERSSILKSQENYDKRRRLAISSVTPACT